MGLSEKEILLILEALQHKYGLGYAEVAEVAQLQAKLSIMLQVCTQSSTFA